MSDSEVLDAEPRQQLRARGSADTSIQAGVSGPLPLMVYVSVRRAASFPLDLPLEPGGWRRLVFGADSLTTQQQEDILSYCLERSTAHRD